jgi:hypothetical protein
MEIFEVYAGEKLEATLATLEDAKKTATHFIEQRMNVRIEHPCGPAPTAVWRYDNGWVRAV